MGIPHNAAHEAWLKDWLEKAFVALVIDSSETVGADRDLINAVKTYLNRAVDAARRVLPKKGVSAVGDCMKGVDDSDVDCNKPAIGGTSRF